EHHRGPDGDFGDVHFAASRGTEPSGRHRHAREVIARAIVHGNGKSRRETGGISHPWPSDSGAMPGRARILHRIDKDGRAFLSSAALRKASDGSTPRSHRSNAMAMASPPPMHRVASPWCTSFSFMECNSVTTMRFPYQPIAWLMATLPPPIRS